MNHAAGVDNPGDGRNDLTLVSETTISRDTLPNTPDLNKDFVKGTRHTNLVSAASTGLRADELLCPILHFGVLLNLVRSVLTQSLSVFQIGGKSRPH